ncbi:MAG: carboxypeptidase regulatory-like domain-containing protein [Acidobacteria bacterium]|nr:carboxypeptidase regulatory-like domain-containing protein [Acidobacteriota bacterium]
MMLRLLIIALIAHTLLAQSGGSMLTGTVQDSTGALIPKARVTIVNEESGVSASTETNDSGIYHSASLIPGTYRVEVEAGGFQRLLRRGITVQVSQTLQLDLTLTVGAVQETIEVTSSAPLLEAQSATTGQLIERQMIEGMPLPNRAATALIVLSPAAVVQSQGGGGENLPIFSVGGGRMRNQQFNLDGGNVTNVVGLAVPQQQTSLPMEAMQEFRILSNNYTAEHGHSTGGVITLSTRSGTNAFRGSVFEYARNEAFDARNFFAATRPKFRQHQFGGAIGGPIRKDKTHFFASWERTQQVTGGNVQQTLPTPQQKLGDFSNTRNAAGAVVQIFDPATTVNRVRTAFPGNIIPASRIDSVAKNIAAAYPNPNQPGTITGANNFALNTRPQFDRDIFVTRVDHQFRAQDTLMVRYYINNNGNNNPGVYGDYVPADAAATITQGRTQSLLGAWTHTFSSTLLNEFRLGWVQRKNINTRPGRDGGYASALGLKGVSDVAFPIIGITGYQGLGAAPFRLQTPIRDIQAQNAVSWFRGKHALKFGFEGRYGYNRDDTDTSSSGNFSFVPQITGQVGNNNTGNAFASFLLGEVNAANIVRPDVIASHAAYYAAYVQDDWRVSERLTLNFGLRWEAEVPRTVEENRMNAFDMTRSNPVSRTPGVITFAGRNGVPRSSYDFDPNNFGPRFGFSYRLLSKTVLRGGGGIFYGPTVSGIVATAATLGFSTDSRINASEVGVTSAMRLREGFPSVPRTPIDQLGDGFGAVAPGATPTTAVSFFERNRATPDSYQYNLDIQTELLPNVLLEIGYIGNQSRHLTANDMSINQVRPELIGPGNAQARRPFPQFSNVTLINPAIGSSSYHAGFVKVERRFSKGFSLLAHYTYSSFIDDVESFTEIGSTGNYMDFYNRRLDRGRSGSDIPHRAILSGVYDLPFFRNPGTARAVLGGWRTGALVNFQQGAPFTVFSSVNNTNAFPSGGLRADIIGDPNTGEKSINRWFNIDAFRVPAQFLFGTVGRSTLRSPGLVNFDLNLMKNFQVTERWKVEFRGELYNAFNQTNFGLPAASVGAPAFGTIRSARAARAVQLAARITF